jgi:arsenate reductase
MASIDSTGHAHLTESENPRNSPLVLWHNPGCSKSRAVADILDSHEIPYAVRDYRVEPPTVDELNELERRTGRDLHALVRKSEPEWAQLGFENHPPSDRELAEAIARHPVLLERPILANAVSAVVGRPPEVVLPWLMANGFVKTFSKIDTT